MKRCTLVLGMLLLMVCGITAQEAGSENKGARRPNILWIFLEDTSAYFGCYGDEINKGHTPTIDGMAESGVLFERCYMPAPVCSATRSALIVGAMQTTTGTHQHRAARCTPQRDKNPQNLYPLPEPYRPIPQLIKEAGYHTFNAGKDDYNFTYDRRDLYSSGNPDSYQFPYNGWQGWFGKGSWNDRKDKQQPWFGQIMLYGGKSHAKGLPKDETLPPGSVELPPYFPDTPAFQEAWTHHWNACRNADREVGRIIENLKKDGELENTIIFFFSDHGDNRSLRHKQFCYEGGVHVPLVVMGNHPSINQGSVRSEIMSGLDISATTLALAGVKPPDYLEGRDLFGENYKVREYVVSARDRCDYTIDRIRTIRTDQYRYIRNYFPERPLLQPAYRDGQQTVKDLKQLHAAGKLTPLQDEIFFGVRAGEELYDMEQDPHQINNLALDPGFKAQLLKHRRMLDQWILDTDDKGQYPESNAEMRAQVRFWKGRTVNPEFDKYEAELKFAQTAVSPDGRLKPRIYVDGDGVLTYDLHRGATQVMQPSKMGIQVDGIELGRGVSVESVSVETHTGAFDWLGTSSTVSNNYVAENFEVTHAGSGRKWMLETRSYDTGFAFRYVVPGARTQTVNGESTTWNLPADAELWYHKNGGAFQTYWKKDKAAEIESGFNAQLNVTVELADGSYASLNEAGSFSFSGTSLEFNGSTEATTLFAGDKGGWKIRGGQVVTPWRIVMATKDLNDLINCNLTVAVCPAPDEAIFPEGCQTEWIQPGRSLWQWWGYWNPGTLWERQRWFVDNAAALGCQYYLVDEGWEHPAQGWVTEDRTAWEALKELADYAAERGVKLMVWRSYPSNANAYYEGMETVQKRTAFYKNCKKAGVYGAKIDFLNSENVEHSSFMHDCLAEAAGYELLINFHGAPKPRGEERTYPNQVSREGVVGMEHNKWETIPRDHYATSPFTRGISGYVDFTVTTFQPDFVKGTTSASQLAQAIVFTSPALHWADKPQYYLNSPAVDLIRSVPTVWDETIVLPGSKIGTQAAFARRKGQDWYVGIINGTDDEVTQKLDLSFLGAGRFASTLFNDVPGRPVEKEKVLLTAGSGDSVDVRMSSGGGFVAVFRKLEAVPYGGPIYGRQTVALRGVDGAEIRYTLDGSEPTASSRKYKKPFVVKKSCLLRAKVVDGDGAGSEISARFIELDVPMPEEDGDSILRSDASVELMNLTSGDIYYTLDGSKPTPKSIRYTAPIALKTDSLLKAITVVNGRTSAVFEKRYQKQPAPAPLPQVSLTDLKPLGTTVGWDRVRFNENLSGSAISIEGKQYESGILAHAPSVLEYKLEENHARFVAGMGVDDAKQNATVIFKVQVDGGVLAESPVLKSGLTWYFDVEIPEGSHSIKLICEDAGDGKNGDHSAWVNAGFLTQ